ncbi:unnamed protein product [Caenorhabditis auriculariae]|uniref:Bridge-like lipid transfer protein family member 1 C-terminal domain-containing protein n=1 Tax=Caenorhabditis auriculariae TaxID=2777116 RepID=A0A8S1H213_9PELO|nr:unnamed protein product [Caenorhabditis auriculariae]
MVHFVLSNSFVSFAGFTFRQATAIGGPAKWVLSVCAEMKGVVIDLDQRIGKLAKMLVNTFSIFGEDEDDGTSLFDEHRELDSDEEKIEGAAEFANLRVEERIPWMENKMHERSRAVFDLVSRGASQKKLEAETQKLRQLELIRFKEFRRTMVEKWQKRGQASTPRSHQRPRRDSILSTKAKEVVSNVTGKHARPANTPQPVVEEIRDLETVNFNVTVKVSIDSGNCTLRTAKQEGAVPMTFGGKIGETLAAVNRGTRDIKAMFEQPNMTTTTFSIPSLEIKANHVSDQTDAMAKATADRFQSYASQGRANSSREAMEETRAENAKMKVGEEPKPKGAPRTTNSPSAFSPMRKVTPQKAPKRGCFYLFIGLSSMPTETVVTPHLATYLEQVLEPLPPSSVFRSSQADPENEQSRANSPVSHDNNIVAMDTAALPMDVMFYLDVQSSTIRFDGKKPSASGRSQSAVDCLLTLPRLTVELTTRRTDEDGYVGGMDISGQFKGFLLSIYSPHQDPTAAGALKLSLDTLLFVISRSKNSSSEADNRVRFVLTSQIGKASFEYDMRRLGELIQFPKPWYRAAIARRVFFGDQSAPRHRDDNSDTATARSHFHSAQAASKKDTTTNSASNTSVATHIPKPWYASVLVAVQWKEFDVFAQMSNTMGKTTWKARKGRLSGNAKLNSKLERDINVKFKLGSSELRAREGAISGDICFNTLVLSASHTLYADVAKPPKNEGKFDLRWISATVEWMSRRVFLAKWTQPSLVASDYHLAEKNSEKKRLAALGVNVRSSWDDLQVVIMRTTIDDLKSIVLKLTTFFQEQLKNSRIMWGIMDTSLKKPPIREQPSMPKTNLWEKIIDYVSEMQLREQLMGLMEKDGIAVGGNVDLNAGKISLVLMQGDMNSNCWAVFHLREAGIAFSPQARLSYMNEEYDHLGILLTQKFILRLGKEKKDRVENMANVCRVQTRHNLSRQQASIDSVLEYLISDVLKVTGLHVNPEHDADILQEVAAKNLRADPKAMSSATSLRTAAGTPPLPLPKDHKGLVTSKSAHSVLELFQFPALEAVMTSRQLNGVDEGEGYAEIMKSVMEVYSTFVCDFHDEVAIETDFNAQVSFLPELLKSYLNEPRLTGSTTSSSCESLTAKETSSDPRVFICEKWIVEPKMRFIDRIKWKPPVVDEILRKLQIFDHRNTIPKVIQRAVLDPLDTVLAGAVIAALHLVDTQHTIAAFKRSRAPEAPSSNEGQPEASAPSMALPALRPLSLSMTPSAAERTKHQRARSDGRKFQH